MVVIRSFPLGRYPFAAVRKNKKLLIYVKEPGGRKYIAMGRFIEDDYLTADAITHYPFDWGGERTYMKLYKKPADDDVFSNSIEIPESEKFHWNCQYDADGTCDVRSVKWKSCHRLAEAAGDSVRLRPLWKPIQQKLKKTGGSDSIPNSSDRLGFPAES